MIIFSPLKFPWETVYLNLFLPRILTFSSDFLLEFDVLEKSLLTVARDPSPRGVNTGDVWWESI